MHPLEYRFISEAETDQFEGTAHNPPQYNASFTSKDFSKEWKEVRATLKRRLEIFGEEWDGSTAAGDFMLSESHDDSRRIDCTLMSSKMLRRELIVAVADFLGDLPLDYQVHFGSGIDEEDLVDNPLVYIIITATTVFGRAQQGRLSRDGKVQWSEWNKALCQLGFPTP